MISKVKSKINSSNIAKRLASGAFWSFLGTFLSRIIIFIGGIYCVRVLGKETFGKFDVVRSTISMMMILGATGLGLVATKHIAQYRKEEKERISSIYLLSNGAALIIGLFLSLILFLSAQYIAETRLNSSDLKSSIQLGAFLLFIVFINISQKGVLSGFEDFKSIAINQFIGSIFESVFMVLGAYYYGLEGAVLGFGMGYLVIMLCNSLSIRKVFKKNSIHIALTDFNKKDLKLLYTFVLPATLSSIMVTPVLYFVREMLANHNAAGEVGGFGEVGLYGVADQLKLIILFIPSAISGIILPILSSINNKDNKKYFKVLNFNILLNALIASIIVIFVILFSNLIMSMYGKGFTDTTPLIIISISTIFTTISNVIGLSLSSRNKMWIAFAFNSIWGILSLALSYIFINNNMGASGVALAILISYFIHCINMYIYIRIVIINSNKITLT